MAYPTISEIEEANAGDTFGFDNLMGKTIEIKPDEVMMFPARATAGGENRISFLINGIVQGTVLPQYNNDGKAGSGFDYFLFENYRGEIKSGVITADTIMYFIGQNKYGNYQIQIKLTTHNIMNVKEISR